MFSCGATGKTALLCLNGKKLFDGLAIVLNEFPDFFLMTGKTKTGEVIVITRTGKMLTSGTFVVFLVLRSAYDQHHFGTERGKNDDRTTDSVPNHTYYRRMLFIGEEQ